jgi:hypothetical protein
MATTTMPLVAHTTSPLHPLAGRVASCTLVRHLSDCDCLPGCI